VQALRRYFITGFFVIVPVGLSIAALVWTFRVVDGIMGPVYARLIGREILGLGILTFVIVIFATGVVASNVLGKRVLQRAEYYLLLVPVFRTIYAPIKQLIVAFAPDNEAGFKRVVLIDAPGRGGVLGFLTREFTVDRGQGPDAMVAVYVPTNHLYLGDVLVFRAADVAYPDISVEQGIRIFLTGGMALPPAIDVPHR
jgi:uncharacterized membrane protein